LQNVRWLRPFLLAVDLALLVGGLFIDPVISLILGLLLILLNELLTPVVVQRVFIKELKGKLTMSGAVEGKVIRRSEPSIHTDEGQNGAEEDP